MGRERSSAASAAEAKNEDLHLHFCRGGTENGGLILAAPKKKSSFLPPLPPPPLPPHTCIPALQLPAARRSSPPLAKHPNSPKTVFPSRTHAQLDLRSRTSTRRIAPIALASSAVPVCLFQHLESRLRAPHQSPVSTTTGPVYCASNCADVRSCKPNGTRDAREGKKKNRLGGRQRQGGGWMRRRGAETTNRGRRARSPTLIDPRRDDAGAGENTRKKTKRNSRARKKKTARVCAKKSKRGLDKRDRGDDGHCGEGRGLATEPVSRLLGDSPGVRPAKPFLRWRVPALPTLPPPVPPHLTPPRPAPRSARGSATGSQRRPGVPCPCARAGPCTRRV